MTSHTLPDIAEQLGVSLRTVHSWVADGELRAVSVSRSRKSRKPRLRALDSDLQAFLASRQVGGEARPQRRARRKLPPTKTYV